jgi:CBS domain-containing protein
VELAARLLIRHSVAAIPVVEHCRTVGIVTAGDLLKALLDVVEAAKRGTKK